MGFKIYIGFRFGFTDGNSNLIGIDPYVSSIEVGMGPVMELLEGKQTPGYRHDDAINPKGMELGLSVD